RFRMEESVEIYLYLVPLVTRGLRRRRMRCWKKELQKEDGLKNLSLA
nr:hypothetical protein [Tanacetum cinerariifolium]